MNAEIISVGTELLLGHTINTDAAFVARELSAIGVNLLFACTVGDNPGRLRDALEEALGMEAQKNMMPIQPGDVLDTSADTQALYDLVGFKPQTSVKEGVKNFVEWYKDYYQI